jgi:hypothetical protein
MLVYSLYYWYQVVFTIGMQFSHQSCYQATVLCFSWKEIITYDSCVVQINVRIYFHNSDEKSLINTNVIVRDLFRLDISFFSMMVNKSNFPPIHNCYYFINRDWSVRSK